jgi:ubiquinone/menaquinone biosynthesis C-methylase UbiE
MDSHAGWSETMPWWDIYFNELYLRMFETILTPERTAQEVAGIMTMLDLRPGSRILDLCCGQGRHAVPLTQAGYRMTGLDRSVYLLGQAKSAADTAGVEVQWVRGDMRQLPWREQFDACLSLFSAFGYFEDDAENELVLHQVASALKPGGAFLLDVANRDYCLLRLWPNTWQRLGQAAILEETTFDPLTSRFTTTFTWVDKGKYESLTHLVRHYTAPELTGMLKRAGLVPVAYYGGFEGEEFDLYSSRLIVIAEKPRE